QYRHKGAAPALRRQQARALRELTRDHDASLVINDDLALALQVQADGGHLGRDGGTGAQPAACGGGGDAVGPVPAGARLGRHAPAARRPRGGAGRRRALAAVPPQRRCAGAA
ncbi:MAG: thiamine phosphate synthase, partial [Betaproteobacteria bacterium]